MLYKGESINIMLGGFPPFCDLICDGQVIKHMDAPREDKKTKYQAAQTFTGTAEKCGWRDIPSTYIVCNNDNDLRTVKQRQMAQRASKVKVLDCGHYPFFTNTKELADILLEIS